MLVVDTVSIGVAVESGAGCALKDLYRMADAALYEAKAGGRNRPCVASRPMVRLAHDKVA